MHDARESKVDEIYTKEPAEIPGYKHRGADFDMPIHDYHCSIISLPYILNMNFIPNDPYLKSTKKFNTEDYKDNFKIGIVWAGNPQHPNDKYRSCKLKDFKKIHDIPNVKLFNTDKFISSFNNWPNNKKENFIKLVAGKANFRKGLAYFSSLGANYGN
jgi:hypothetical protein